jgi:hypothetical protein
MALPRHPQVARWIASLDEITRAAVDEVISYLEEHGRAAALPDVRHRIQTSEHFPDMSELRIQVDRAHVLRVLVGFGPDERPVLLIAGNKAGVGNAWYEANVPLADSYFDTYLAALNKSKEA